MAEATPRNAEMLYLRQAGETYAAIASQYGVSKGRVAQIVAREARRPDREARNQARRLAVESAEVARRESEREARIAALVASGTDGLLVEELELSVRAANCLRNAGLVFARDVARLSMEELVAIPNMGRRTANEVVEVLAPRGIKFPWQAQ